MVDQTDRAELRKLVDAERQALAEMQASVGEQGADVTKLDAWIKASGEMATAARVHFPALLDELDAADLASLPCKSGEGAGERQAIARIIRGHMPSHWCDEDALRTEAFSTALADAIVDATQTREAELVAALEPFANHGVGASWLEMYGDDEHVDTCAFTAGDFRRARAALNARGGA